MTQSESISQDARREDSMQRRDFLKASGTATAAVLAGSWPVAADAIGDWPSDLASHRIAKIETQRSADRYTRSLGPNSKRGPHGRGYSRPLRTVTTDQGAVGFGVCWAPGATVKPARTFSPHIHTLIPCPRNVAIPAWLKPCKPTLTTGWQHWTVRNNHESKIKLMGVRGLNAVMPAPGCGRSCR